MRVSLPSPHLTLPHRPFPAPVPFYEHALDLIRDVAAPRDAGLSEEQQDSIEAAAELLYGLIHARYIITPRGLNAMLEKFKAVHFGRCPEAR